MPNEKDKICSKLAKVFTATIVFEDCRDDSFLIKALFNSN